jgi:hypothetical protein
MAKREGPPRFMQVGDKEICYEFDSYFVDGGFGFARCRSSTITTLITYLPRCKLILEHPSAGSCT